MASPSTVITLGYGSFGGVGLLPTLGFGVNQAIVVAGPYAQGEVFIFVGGEQRERGFNIYTPPPSIKSVFNPTAHEIEVTVWRT